MNTLPTMPNAVKVAAIRQINQQHPTWRARIVDVHAARCCAGHELLTASPSC